MSHLLLLCVSGFLTAFLISLATTPLAKKISVKVGAIDYPRKRGMHKEPIPRMGGIAIIMGVLVTLAIMILFVPQFRTEQFFGFIVGALVIAFTGIIDDIYTIKPGMKLSLQFVAALIVVFTGTEISFQTLPSIQNFVDIFNAPITIIWIIGITNAVNLIDGVDGLAAGVSSICALSIMVLCILSGSPLAVVLSATLAGSCFGFLPRNFSPAEVIMGDTGALFLGFVLAVSSIIGVFKAAALLSVVVACFAIALPIFDTLFAMVRRFFQGKPIFEADRGHLHHRLIDSGYSASKTVLILYLVSAICGIIAILIAVSDARLLIIAVFLLVVLIIMVHTYRKRTSDSHKEKKNV